MKRELGLCVICFLFGIFAVRVYDYSTVTRLTNPNQSTDQTAIIEPLITLLPPLSTQFDPKPNSNSGSKYGFGYPVNATWRSEEKQMDLVEGPRSRPPSAYSLQFESFTTLINSGNTDNYISRPFFAGGYNWSLIVYPHGNKKDFGEGYISVYVMLDNSSLIIDPWVEIYADLEFFVYNKKEESYYTMKFTEVKRFSQHQRVWGFSQVLPLETFKDVKNGYLYDGDHCEFGVDVFVAEHFKTWEVFTILDDFRNPKYVWSLKQFSTLTKRYYTSDDYFVGERNWYLQVYPGGDAKGEGNSVSVYISLGDNEILRPYQQIYAIVYIRLLDQLNSNHVEYKIERWYEKAGAGWGRAMFLSFEELKDPSRGFLVRDTMKLEVEFVAVSATKYFP